MGNSTDGISPLRSFTRQTDRLPGQETMRYVQLKEASLSGLRFGNVSFANA
jgi:hypothetical protein